MPPSRPAFQHALGRAVKERRGELGLTQEEMANESGLDQRWISNVECGWRNPSLRSLRRLGEALDLSASQLLAQSERHERALLARGGGSVDG
jgi:transcriptional regulator with XRE-family HTH domain